MNTTDTKIKHRITTLERWGMRVHADFQPDAVACIREAGFTGVFVNGGSGIGPDMMSPESLVVSPVIPDLMPLTVKGNQREMKRRCDLLQSAGLKPWLCLWGVPGPDESADSVSAESNRFFDRRSKLEMKAKLVRTPEIFGYRNPQGLSWRGSRPLCVSHPLVKEYYQDLMTRLVDTYPELEGVFFFPGDADPELCDAHCPRCAATGTDQTSVLTDYVNMLYEAIRKAKPDFKFYFTIWNQDKPESGTTIQRFLNALHPGIGICMSLSDNYTEERKSGSMTFNQPWVNCTQPGERFLQTSAKAHKQGRAVMVMGEISQSEVWDPVCHNMPNPRKVLDLLRHTEGIEGADALCDFWGHRGPFHSHANHAAMRAYFRNPQADEQSLLTEAALAHYGLLPEQNGLLRQALQCWQAFDDAVDGWALRFWCQRFSYAIGRDGARGFLYRALIPENFRTLDASWVMHMVTRFAIDTQKLGRDLQGDRVAFSTVASQYDRLALALREIGLMDSASLATCEARNIELAGELFASIARTFQALHAFKSNDQVDLRQIIESEIDGRIRQQEISGRMGSGAGVHAVFVDEDIQNMRLYLSHNDFPQVADKLFHFTATPYST